jgi:hypothetical protein
MISIVDQAGRTIGHTQNNSLRIGDKLTIDNKGYRIINISKDPVERIIVNHV